MSRIPLPPRESRDERCRACFSSNGERGLIFFLFLWACASHRGEQESSLFTLYTWNIFSLSPWSAVQLRRVTNSDSLCWKAGVWQFWGWTGGLLLRLPQTISHQTCQATEILASRVPNIKAAEINSFVSSLIKCLCVRSLQRFIRTSAALLNSMQCFRSLQPFDNPNL